MNIMVRISVVVPTWRRPVLLKRCLQSIALQHFDAAAYEIIVVCDGIDNITASVVKEFQKNYSFHSFRFISTGKKAGPASARNAGWRTAKGVLIAFTDDDCIADVNWLQRLWKQYVNRDADEIVYTGRMIVPLPAKPTDFEKNLANLERSEFVTANCACSKKALQRVNGFDEAFTMAWREDSDLHFKLLAANVSIVKVNDAIIIHPVRDAKWGISIYEQKKAMFNALLYKKHPSYYRKRIRPSPSWNYYFIIFFFTAAFLFILLKAWLPAFASFMLWLLLTGKFFIKRLSGTTKNITHITEMIVTSVLIPFLSVYWTLYGSYRFKTLLL